MGKSYGGSESDGSARILNAVDNNFYILGSALSSDGDISFDPYPNTVDFWIIKIDINGNIIWGKIVGGNADDTMWTGIADTDGGVVALGYSASGDGDVTIHYGAYDIWMVKLNNEGEIEWDFTLGTDWFDYGQAIIQTSDGGFLVGGTSAIGEGGNLTCEPFNYKAKAILVKLDADRNIEWQQCYGGSEHDGVYSILELDDGYMFTAFTESPDGDVSGWHGDDDIWVVKIDFGGNIIWEHCFGGYKDEIAFNILQTNDEGFIIIGQTQSNDGDVSGNHSLSEYDNDIWMFKLDSEGELIWQQCIGGAGSEATPGLNFGVIKKSDNNFIIAGQTNWGTSYDVQCTPHGGNPLYEDFWVFEIKDTSTNVIGKIESKNGFKVYPNPAKDYVVFEFSEPKNIKQETRIIVMDVLGKVIETLQLDNDKKVWDTREVKSGTYFYCVQSGLKIIKRGKIVILK